MNAAHFHLVINHFPVVLMLASAAIGIHGILRKSKEVQGIAMSLSVVASLATLATYFSGEPAADFLENAAIVNDTHIEEHEEAAEKAVIVTTVTGLAAATAFFLASRKSPLAGRAYMAATGMAIASSVILGWTGAKGGVIRHPEVAEPTTGRAGGMHPLPSSEGAGSGLEESGDQDIDTEFEANPSRTESQP
ncbi:MAG: hypothetical protein EBU49_05100 [Proteobacteria bacterium]|nr:hypothetical protein [Pseudomonadota bacterium]